jgi:heme/copper-type cytochrome/quinol oxidase subunit 2
MAVATDSTKRKRRKPMAKKKNISSWWTAIPVVVGILLTPVAMRAADVLALSGPDALILLYPWVAIVKSPMLKVSADVTMQIAQWIMYFQFPVYGLIMMWLLRKGQSFGALIAVILVHSVGVTAVYGLGLLQGNHIRLLP